MDNLVTITVPDIGDFEDVEIIEVLVHVGDQIKVEDSLITVESDKASMEIPAPNDGEITELLVSVGDRISTGTAIAVIATDAAVATDATDTAQETPPTTEDSSTASSTASGSVSTSSSDTYDVVVIGAGPVSYTHLTLPTICSV